MKLVPKLSVAFIGGVSVILAVNGYLRVRREVALFESDRIRDDVQIGKTLAAAVATVWQSDGPTRALSMVKQADGQEGRVRVRWVRLDADATEPLPVPRETVLAIPPGGSLSLVGSGGRRGDQRYTFVPVDLAGPQRGALEISEPLETERAYIHRTIMDTVATTLTLDAVCAALAMLLGAWIVGRPMRALVEKARRVGSGDFGGPLRLRQTDEIAGLAAEMNAMCDRLVDANERAAAEMRARLEMLEQLRHADRLMTVGKLASGLAHELGTPLNVIEARASMIGNGETTQEESMSYARVVVRAADRMTRIIRQLLAFARPRDVQKSRCDVNTVAQRTVELLQPLAEKRKVTLRVEGLSPAYTEADAGQIEQAITNLVMNATQAMDHPGKVELKIDRARAKPPADHGGPEADYLRVCVQDEGHGIPPEHLPRVFEPFFTTKDVGEGTGLGLAVTYGIIREHGGWIAVASEVGRGTAFTIHLPAAPDAPTGEAMTRVLVVDDDSELCETIEAGLKKRAYDVAWVTRAEAAFDRLLAEEFDVVITDMTMPGTDGIALCEKIVATRPDVPVVVMTAFGSFDSAVAAIRAGAYDFINKPVQMDVLAIAIDRAARTRALREEVRRLRSPAKGHSSDGLVGQSEAMRKVYDLVERVADSEATILITGESGTGKEVFANAIHRRSRRARGPFVAVNCTAMPETLLESELFGHTRGAFTDAREARAGLFVQARGGTLLLDEVGDMPMALQPKILRVLQERKVRPLGSSTEIAIDVRVIAATNRDLEGAIEEKRFREDLYFRLNVIQIPLPPLRSRAGDVLPLAQRLLETFAERAAKPITAIAPAAAEKLVAYSWPGNVRELQNCIERAVALARFEHIVVEDLPEKIRDHHASHVLVTGDDPSELVPMEEVERRYVLRVLEAVRGNKAAAARILGFERKTLYRKLERWGLDPGPAG